MSFFLFQQLLLFRILGHRHGRAGVQQRETPASMPSPFSTDGAFTPSPLPASSMQRMLGGEALQFFVELRGLGFGVAERFEGGDDFVLVGVGGGVAQGLR